MNPALELVNSEWWRGRPGSAVDKLRDPDWLRSFTGAAGFGELEPPTPGRLHELTELRRLLRRLVERPTGRDAAALDAYVARAPVRRRVTGGAITLEPVTRDWPWAISEIAASFVPLLADPSRIKVCANHECQWSFYDESRNRSRRWCGASSCGNADKVRRFRARKRAEAAT